MFKLCLRGQHQCWRIHVLLRGQGWWCWSLLSCRSCQDIHLSQGLFCLEGSRWFGGGIDISLLRRDSLDMTLRARSLTPIYTDSTSSGSMSPTTCPGGKPGGVKEAMETLGADAVFWQFPRILHGSNTGTNTKNIFLKKLSKLHAGMQLDVFFNFFAYSVGFYFEVGCSNMYFLFTGFMEIQHGLCQHWGWRRYHCIGPIQEEIHTVCKQCFNTEVYQSLVTTSKILKGVPAWWYYIVLHT